MAPPYRASSKSPGNDLFKAGSPKLPLWLQGKLLRIERAGGGALRSEKTACQIKHSLKPCLLERQGKISDPRVLEASGRTVSIQGSCEHGPDAPWSDAAPCDLKSTAMLRPRHDAIYFLRNQKGRGTPCLQPFEPAGSKKTVFPEPPVSIFTYPLSIAALLRC